jgi:hypothetical protein
MKKTPWFRVGTNPTRVGWYEVEYVEYDRALGAATIKPAMLWWSGADWLYSPTSRIGPVLIWASDRWRGLAEKA